MSADSALESRRDSYVAVRSANVRLILWLRRGLRKSVVLRTFAERTAT